MREARIAAQAVVAIRLRVARHIQPVAAPAFAEVRRLQQLIHELLERPMAAHKCRNFPSSWGQADEIEIDASDEHFLSGVVGRGDAFGFKLGEHKAVDGMTRPFLGPNQRHLRVRDGLIRPQRGLVRGHCLLRGLGQIHTRIRRAHFDPGDEITHHLLRQTLLRRHFEAIVAERLHNQALIRLAGDHRWARLASGDHF